MLDDLKKYSECELRMIAARAFHTRYQALIDEDVSSEIKSLNNLLKKKSISESFKNSVKNEIKRLESQGEDLTEELEKIFCENMYFIWNHPEKETKLIIHKNESVNSYRDSDGKYDVVTYFTFSGELGELMTLLISFVENGEIYFSASKDENVSLNNNLDYQEFKKLFLNKFTDMPENFKEMFKKVEKKNEMVN